MTFRTVFTRHYPKAANGTDRAKACIMKLLESKRDGLLVLESIRKMGNHFNADGIDALAQMMARKKGWIA